MPKERAQPTKNTQSLSNSPTGAAGIKTKKNKKPRKRTKRK